MSDLPEGWVSARLGDALVVNPRKPAKDSVAATTHVTFVPMAAVDDAGQGIVRPEERTFGAVRNGYTAFRNGDVLFAKITPCMENGKAAVARGLTNGLGFGSSEFHVLRSAGAVIPEYVFHFVRQQSFRELAEANMTGTVGQRRVPRAFLEDFALPLPPLSEQMRIVAKVDDIVTRISDVQRVLADCSTALNHAILAAEHSEFRVEESEPGELSSPWKLVPLSELATRITKGTTPTTLGHAYTPAGVRFVKAESLEDGRVLPDRCAFISDETNRDLGRSQLVEGDLLVTIAGTLGRVALVSPDDLPANTNQAVSVVRLKDPSKGRFIRAWLASATGQRVLISGGRGVGLKNLNLKQIGDVLVPMPPPDERERVTAALDAANSLAASLRARFDGTVGNLDTLQQAVLNHAFAGRLVPTEGELARREGRDYEPASVLLERIKAEREMAEPQTRTRRRARTR